MRCRSCPNDPGEGRNVSRRGYEIMKIEDDYFLMMMVVSEIHEEMCALFVAEFVPRA